ncbi:hypothetical protein SNEBB_005712 [Seison nebaliae]|nr:hypothetical protein SNEBB_005712 [Seison nebaliae]
MNKDKVHLSDNNENIKKSVLPPNTPNVLNLEWCYGYDSKLPVISLEVNDTRKVAYISSNVVIIQDFLKNKQTLLPGHQNNVTCLAVSTDKRWLVSADSGPESSLIVWDTESGIPIQTYFSPYPDGISDVRLTLDNKYLYTLSKAKPQVIAIWKWTLSTDTPFLTYTLPSITSIHFDFFQLHNDSNENFLLQSNRNILFGLWKKPERTRNVREGFDDIGEEDCIITYQPEITDKTFNKALGTFTESIFLPENDRVITGTSLGNLIVFEPLQYQKSTKYMRQALDKEAIIHREPLKICRICDNRLNCLVEYRNQIVIGDESGRVLFYSSELQLIMSFNHFDIGPITSISFAHLTKDTLETYNLNECESTADLHSAKFTCRNFVIGTKESVLAHVFKAGTTIDIITREATDTVDSITTHPYCPRFFVAGYCGVMILWNYETKKRLANRKLEDFSVACVAFNSSGDDIAIGGTNGHILIVDSLTLENVHPSPYTFSKTRITIIKYSSDDVYLATAEQNLTLSIYKMKKQRVGEEKRANYMLLGRYRPHSKRICSILFGGFDNNTLVSDQRQGDALVLFSLSEDRTLVEFDLTLSIKDNLLLKSLTKVDQSAIPICMEWLPGNLRADDVHEKEKSEYFLVIANNEWKFKMFNSFTKLCRKTIIAPTYSTPVQKIIALPQRFGSNSEKESENNYIIFITKNQLGIQRLPLIGNPYDVSAVLAHPTRVSNVACSYDGRYVFTAGHKDESVHQWNVCTQTLEAQKAVYGEDELSPFLLLMDGGRNGKLFKELENVFYFAQLRNQTIMVDEERNIGNTIPIEEIPFVLRTLGYYPSEEEIKNMLNEVRYENFSQTNMLTEHINLPNFIRLYLNHRDSFGLTPDVLSQSANLVFGNGDQTFDDMLSGDMSIKRQDFIELMTTKGEPMTYVELANAFIALRHLKDEQQDVVTTENAENIIDSLLPEQIDCNTFFDEMLGLEVEKLRDSEDKSEKELINEVMDVALYHVGSKSKDSTNAGTHESTPTTLDKSGLSSDSYMKKVQMPKLQ